MAITVRAVAALAIATSVASAQTVGQQRRGPPRARVITTFSYTGELVQNVGGGARRGATFPGLAGVQITLPLEPLMGWTGARLFAFALGTHGGAPSAFVGDVQGVSNLEAAPTVRLEEAWLQQNLFANRLSWLVGRYDLNTEFYRLQSGALFINSSFGIGPELSHSGAGNGPSIYPTTVFGTRLDFKPSRNIVWRAAALDGPMLISEVAILARPVTAEQPRHRRFGIGRGLTRAYAAKLALGAWYYTGQFADLSDATRHRGSGGAYLLGDITMRSLTAFAQLGLGDGRVNQIGGYVGGGLTLSAPLSSRPQDMVGLAVAAARNGSHFERAQATAGIPAAGETTVELTYLAQLGSWLSIQPDAQYVIHPSGTRVLRNATVLGLRVAVSH